MVCNLLILSTHCFTRKVKVDAVRRVIETDRGKGRGRPRKSIRNY